MYAVVVSPCTSKISGLYFIKTLLTGVSGARERFKPKEIAKILLGESNALIKQNISQLEEVFGIGKDKPLAFWHSLIRQAYVKKLLTKDIESYGILKLTDLGKDFIKKPYSFKITEDHHYEENISNNNISQKSQAADELLFNLLKDVRKKLAKEIGLPPAIIFTELSLVDMANQYPISMEEMAKIQGVGIGKAKKFGEKFITKIKNYVNENNIIRPQDFTVRTAANKSSNKIYITMKNHPSHNKQIASLKRVEGQIRGIINMVNEEKYCVDILYQIKAAKSALVSVESKILKNHIESCVKNSLENKNDVDAKVSELLKLINK